MDSAHDSREPRVTPEANLSLNPVATNLAEPVSPGNKPATPAKVSRATVWLHRISLVIYVMFCIELGMLLTVLPWTHVWTDNSLLTMHPLLRSIVQDNFFRGTVTGFGLTDVWIGIWEAVHYRDPGKPKNNL
jgi:hypothetical protein